MGEVGFEYCILNIVHDRKIILFVSLMYVSHFFHISKGERQKLRKLLLCTGSKYANDLWD
jgi:hypothetical protein